MRKGVTEIKAEANEVEGGKTGDQIYNIGTLVV